MELLKKYSPKQIQKAIEIEKGKRSRGRLAHFVQNSFEGYEMGWVHKELCEVLEQFEQDILDKKSPRLLISMPPRHGKSMIVSERFPAWFLGRNPRLDVACTSYAASLAEEFSKKARDLCNTEWYRSVFPKFSFGNTGQLKKWNTDKGGHYFGLGVGGGFTGKGAHCLLIDDSVKDHEDAYSPTKRETVWNWYLSVANTRIMPGGGILVMQTRWHKDDLTGRILEEMKDPNYPQFKQVFYPAIAEKDEEHRKIGEALHPDRFPLKDLKIIKRSVGDRVWTSLYQQKPRKEGGAYIKSEWFDGKKIPMSEVPEGLKWVRYWDLAIKAKETNDNTASSSGAMDKEGNLYIRHQKAFKTEWGDTKRTIVNLAKRESIPVGIENVAAMEIAVQEVKKELRGLVSVSGIPSTKDKLTRALPWIDLAENGKMYLVRDDDESVDWIPDFLNEAEDFDPMQSKQTDDRIDSVSGIYSMVYKKRTARVFI